MSSESLLLNLFRIFCSPLLEVPTDPPMCTLFAPLNYESSMKVLCRHPECYREGGAAPSAMWAISYMPGGHIFEISANRSPNSGICLTRVAARRRGRGGGGGRSGRVPPEGGPVGECSCPGSCPGRASGMAAR